MRGRNSLFSSLGSPMVSLVLQPDRRPNSLSLPIWRRSNSRSTLVVVIALTTLLLSRSVFAQTPEEIREQVGYYQLEEALGEHLPKGVGVPISHVEARENLTAGPPIYFPNPLFSDFLAGGQAPESDPFAQNVTFIDASGGQANGSSGHATTNVGIYFYGNRYSLSPGANTVTIYEANDWMNNVLNLNGGTPAPHDFRVENFSWIGTFVSETNPTTALDVQTLGRFDYLIDNNNITAVVGINSGGTPTALLSHSLNAISVGVTPGTNPTMPTQNFYFPGRNKPDIVSPGGASSSATANVASAATLLHDSGAGTNATQSETMKAILLAGATKDEFPGWSNSPTQPLDSTFGAGELNIYNSYLIQSGGNDAGSPTEPSSPVGIDGWDYRDSVEGTPLYYNFEVPAGSTAVELSIILTWNAEVTDSDADEEVFVPDVTLDNLDLRLYDSTSTFLGSEIASSVSTVDNVEHLFLTDLSAGTYTLEVTNLTAGGNRDFGLAWRMETLLDDASADFDADGDIDGVDFLTWQRNFGTLTGITHSEGDADGDGDVDTTDRTFFEDELGTSVGPLAALNAIPEPGSFGLGAIGIVLLILFRHFQWSPDHLHK